MLTTLVRFLVACAVASAGLILTLPALALAVPFWLVAQLTRGIARLTEPRYLPWDGVMAFDPDLGWRPKRGLDAHYLTMEQPEVFSVWTDASGWPGRRTIAEADMVVIGDSYAFGYGVDAAKMFAECAGPIQIKSVGAPAYNMAQELLVMRQVASELKGKHVVWLVFLGNDLLENFLPSHLHYRRPFLRRDGDRGEWEIVTRHIEPKRWPFVLEPLRDRRVFERMMAELHRPGPLSERAYSACEYLIREAAVVCREAGARLTVLTVPDPSHVRPRDLERLFALSSEPAACAVSYPDRELGLICGRVGVRFVVGREFLESRHYKEVDPHWSEEGHRRVAEALWRLGADTVTNGRVRTAGGFPAGVRA